MQTHTNARLGKPNAPPANTAENQTVSSTPSSIPSSDRLISDVPPDLARLVGNWHRLQPTLRAAILALAEASLHP